MGLENASNGVLYYGLENELGTAAPGIDGQLPRFPLSATATPVLHIPSERPLE
jgi:hypothetical protein